MFKLNVGKWDRVIRVVLGIILLYLGLGHVITGGWGIALDIIGAILLVTGALGFCPLYYLLKTSTKKS